MCGIAGVISLSNQPIPKLTASLLAMNTIQAHRGPDGHDIWLHPRQHVGLAHRRLSIIGLADGDQPMRDERGNWLIFNGEIYNYIELRQALGEENFQTTTDTEVILWAYAKWGKDCLTHLRGMFSLALWDESNQELFCARDRFGIKPFYYTVVGNVLYFASEAKTLMPFLPTIETNFEGLRDYLTFQFMLGGKTLFKDVHELEAGHWLMIRNGEVKSQRYWEVYFDIDWNHTDHYFQTRLQELFEDSVQIHTRADVPIGGYISGGLDSSAVAAYASQVHEAEFMGFTGKFDYGSEYDESQYARDVASENGIDLREITIQPTDFIQHIQNVIYHLDYPVAGPGSFPQYMVSQLAAKHRKVVLGGQGGDEIFGGYTRYLIAYFEQCIKGAIDGTLNSGNFVVTYESIIPNLPSLYNYKPLMRKFWSEGLFDEMDRRYFYLINRGDALAEEVRHEVIGDYDPFVAYYRIFSGDNVTKGSYFDRMTHFDFKTLLPALLQVEDRVSMAHGLESRVPLLDHPLVEFAATVPADMKFQNGELKRLLKTVVAQYLPKSIVERKDKMGFPVPLTQWFKQDIHEFVMDIFRSHAALGRDFVNNEVVSRKLFEETNFGRATWGWLSLELWQQAYHDRHETYRQVLTAHEAEAARRETEDTRIQQAN